MPRVLSIPERGERALLALASLPSDQGEALVDALEIQGHLLTPEQIESRIAKAAPFLVDDAEEVTYALLNLIARHAQEPAPQELVPALLRGAAFRELPEPDRAKLTSYINRLLDKPGLRVSAKAWDLATEYEHIFLEARILTDVRPVFDAADDDTPAAAVVVDTLKLDYYDPAGHTHSLHLVLDRDDLEELAATATRALRKTDGMSEFLATSRLPSWKASD